MIPPDAKSLCRQAEPYYFDIMSGRANDPVPAEVLEHVEQCPYCKAEIQHLKTALYSAEPDDQTQAQKDNALTTSLELHYAYTKRPVTCDHVKPFLPSLADPALEIRVPTPITVHLDNCGPCGDDLETIRQLNLTHEQLCRLGQLYAERPAANPLMCVEVKKVIPFMARLDFQSMPADILKHMSTCAECRRLLSEKRAAKWETQGHEQVQLPCSHVIPRDIFDYVIPYGIDPQNDEYAEFRKPLAAHAATCPDCFGKIQDLHSAVFQILERPASGTVTRFQISDTEENTKPISSPYADWPITVEVTHKIALSRRFKERFAAVNLKPFIKPAAAAAIVLFALTFYFNTSIVRATDLAQIYKAIAQITNVYIASFVPSIAEPTQQQWISKTLDISIFKTSTETVMWDIPNSSRRVKNLAAGTVEITPLSGESAAGIRKNIDGSFGLLPFKELSEMPQEAKWRQVTNIDIKSAFTHIKVYDLIWTEKGSASSDIVKKWRVFVSTETNLPQRVEWYQKTTNDRDYILKSYILVDYLSESQIQAVIRDAAF